MFNQWKIINRYDNKLTISNKIYKCLTANPSSNIIKYKDVGGK